MVFAQKNFVVKDIPGDWVEIIHVSGLPCPHASETDHVVTTTKGGIIKSVVAQITGSNNTVQLILRMVQTTFAPIVYGTALVAATGIELSVYNVDPAVDETGLSCCIIINGA